MLEPGLLVLNTVVITATRNNRNIYEVPQRVDVMDKQKMESVPALSADDYLLSLAGISVSRPASIFGSAYVSMRGMGNEDGRTLVMVDGVPVNKSDGGGVNWNAINTENIGQVEVLKGPGSSIHGGNAMGGAINLISQVPEDKIEGHVAQSYGTFNTFNTQAGISGKLHKFNWDLNGMYRTSDGYVTTPVDDIDEYTVPSFLDEYQVGARAGYSLNENHTVEFGAAYYSGKRGTGASFIGYGFENEELAAPDGAFNRYSGLNGKLTYRGKLKNESDIKVTLYAQRENYENIRESVRSNTITRYDVLSVRDDIGLLSGYNFNWGKFQKLSAGVDIRYGAVDGADTYVTSTEEVLNLGKMNQIGIYLQDEIQIGKTPLNLLAGIRFDYANFYDGQFLVENPTNETAFLQEFAGDLPDAEFSAFSPRISIQYHKPGQFRLFTGYSRGFRAPVLDDMCRTGRISGGMKIANPNLKPEYLDNIELGGDVFIWNRITVSPTLFYSIGSDYHAYIATGDSIILNNRLRPVMIKDNISRVRVAGAEIKLDFNIIRGLNWAITYSYINTEILEFVNYDPENEDVLTGNELVYQPKDIFHTSVYWKNKIVNAAVHFNYKGGQWTNAVNTESIDSFYFMDLKLWREIYKGLHGMIMVHNVFDDEYVDSRNMVSPGRMITAQVSYKF
ncbi:MAG: TonB-dependent receptor [Bacteroidales bacterium]|nr:TonB-dependent receptor [Bacteroidales bacterium]